MSDRGSEEEEIFGAGGGQKKVLSGCEAGFQSMLPT